MEQPPGLVRTSLTETTAENMPAGRWDRIGTYTDGLKLVRAGWTVCQRYLDVILGAVLVLAGALKGHQLLTDPSAGRASGFPRELLIAVSAFELAFGCWLLGGMYRRLTRWIALTWFTSLAAVALAQAVNGAPSCACLGELHADPWLIFAFDIAAVGALWTWSPIVPCSAPLFPVVLFLSLLPATGFLSLAAAPSHQPMFAEIDLGDIAQGGQKQQSFQLRNDSGSFVEVATIETSCPCASIRLERTSVPAGQYLTGNVALDLRPRSELTGNLGIEAKGVTGRGRGAFVLLIRARVHPTSSGHSHSLIRE